MFVLLLVLGFVRDVLVGGSPSLRGIVGLGMRAGCWHGHLDARDAAREMLPWPRSPPGPISNTHGCSPGDDRGIYGDYPAEQIS